MVVINAYAVSDQLAVVVVAEAAATAGGAVVHAWQLEHLALLAIAELGRLGQAAGVTAVVVRVQWQEVIVIDNLLSSIAECHISTLGLHLHAVELDSQYYVLPIG